MRPSGGGVLINNKSVETTGLENPTTLTLDFTSTVAARTFVTEQVAAETTARTAADTTLQNNIDSEISDRKTADTNLEAVIKEYISKYYVSLEEQYPYGSIYTSTNSTMPDKIAALEGWTKIPDGYCLQTGEVNGTEEYVSAGLPDIQGSVIGTNEEGYPGIFAFSFVPTLSGAFTTTGSHTYKYCGTSSTWSNTVLNGATFSAATGETKLDGTLQNDVYGKNDTVQPNTVLINAWIRLES